MLFNSHIFIFAFLPITFFIYYYLNKKRLSEAAKGFLVFSSLFFYSWWNVMYLPLILSSLLFNFIVGESLAKKDQQVSKNILLAVGIAFNVSLLGYFKYVDFFIENFNTVTGFGIPLQNIALPLAISFFTFQQIAYLVDSYRSETKEYDFLNYALFVTFFPQLIAGPIVHHKEMMPQFASRRNLIKNDRNVALGMFIFSMGLFKKVIIADTFAIWATQGFDHAAVLNFFEAWMTSLSYTMQLYFDFSGYTDMAIGAALLFNIRLPDNFNSPYKAHSIQDFWRRWHMTLSRFLKDYIYIPLGGNRTGALRLYGNLMMTFLIAGIWHGASWLFVFWGALHGLALIIHRLWQRTGIAMHPFLAWFLTFNFINISWVFFRAREWDDAVKVLKGMFFGTIVLPIEMHSLVKIEYVSFSTHWLKGINGNMITIAWIIIFTSVALLAKNSNEWRRTFRADNKSLVLASVLFMISVLSLNQVSEFLYFNF